LTVYIYFGIMAHNIAGKAIRQKVKIKANNFYITYKIHRQLRS